MSESKKFTSPAGDVLSAAFLARHRRHRLYGQAVALLPSTTAGLLIKVAHAIGFSEFVYGAKNELEARRVIRLSGADSTAYGTGYGYADEAEDLKVAEFYRSTLRRNERRPLLFDHGIATVDRAIMATGAKRVINFGVCYGHVDAQLAAIHPGVSFVGVDRAPSVKRLNDADFTAPNLEFVAADIIEYLTSQADLGDTLLYHMRTATLLPQAFVKNLYRICGERGLLGVVGIEPYGLSWETGEFYTQSPETKASVAFRKGMILHNYEGMLRENGLQLLSMDYVKLEKESEDFRLQTFIARR